MKKWLAIPLVLLLAFVMVIGSCGEETTTTTSQPTQTATQPTATTPTGPYGTLTIPLGDFGNETFDPVEFESFFGWLIYDGLLTYAPDGNIIGGLAESYTISPDGKTFTFKVRPGVKWHNGDPLIANDFKFSVDRFADPMSFNPWSSFLGKALDYTECPDDQTFVFHAKNPEPMLIVPFSWTRILPSKYVDDNGIDYFRKNPIGTGPWKFVSLTSDKEVIFEANTEHWRTVPSYEKLVFLEIPEEATQIAAFKRGEVDMVQVSFDRTVELRDDGYRLQPLEALPALGMIQICGTWMTDEATKDIRVRKAMSLAINRQEICDTFFLGFAAPHPQGYCMAENSWAWKDTWKPDPYDPDQARALLAEAGYPDAFEKPVVRMYVPSPASWGPDLQQIIAGYWNEVGIQTELINIDQVENMGQFFVRATSPDQPVVGAVEPFFFNAVLNNIYHSANLYSTWGCHSTLNDPKADELYFKATQEMDLEKAAVYFQDFLEYGNAQYVHIGTVKIFSQLVMGPNVGEFTENLHMSLYDALAGLQHAAK